jgi:hypothetical protein
MSDSPSNAFELFFAEASEDPSKQQEFYLWTARHSFVVPAEEAAGALPASQGVRSREIRMTPLTRLRLKAFQTPQGLAVPLFSDDARFEAWSSTDPQGRFVRLKGSDLARVAPPQSSWLLNPNSERFSKWFTVQEVALVSAASA